MSAAQPLSCYAGLYLVCLFLTATPLSVECKLEGAPLGATNAILKDAFSEIQDNDLDALVAEDAPLEEVASDDAGAMRQRLLAIDAERALLRQRLGFEGGEASRDSLGEVFEQLARKLAPLAPQVAWELAALAVSAALVFFVWSAVLQKRRPANRHDVATCFNRSRLLALRGHVRSGPRLICMAKTDSGFFAAQKPQWGGSQMRSDGIPLKQVGLTVPEAAKLEPPCVKSLAGLQLGAPPCLEQKPLPRFTYPLGDVCVGSSYRDVTTESIGSSPSDVAKKVATIQRWWKRISAQTRVAQMGDVFNRLSHIFVDEEREHSDDESTCFLGDTTEREVCPGPPPGLECVEPCAVSFGELASSDEEIFVEDVLVEEMLVEELASLVSVEEMLVEDQLNVSDAGPADKILPPQSGFARKVASIHAAHKAASPKCTELAMASSDTEPPCDVSTSDAEPKPDTRLQGTIETCLDVAAAPSATCDKVKQIADVSMRDAEPKPDAGLQGVVETCVDGSANCDNVKQVAAACESSLTLRFWHCVQSLLPRPNALVDDDVPDACQRKRVQGAAHGSERPSKRKGKQQQQQHPLRQKRNAEVSCSKKYGALWGLRWPCSLPLTAALVAMLGIVLVGKTFENYSFDSFAWEDSLATREQNLEEKRQQLEQLKRKHASFSLRLALLKLEEFQEDAAGVIETLPDERKRKIQGIRADAANLQQALRDIADVEFPQVEESFKSVYAGWQRILRDAQRQEKPPVAHKLPSFMLQAEPTSCTPWGTPPVAAELF